MTSPATGCRSSPGLDVYIHQGWNSSYSHNGRSEYAYDFGLQLNTPVLAAASGIVSYVHGGETACGGASLRNHANYVTIDHPDGSSTQYGHLSTVEVEVGDIVEVGQEIATVREHRVHGLHAPSPLRSPGPGRPP